MLDGDNDQDYAEQALDRYGHLMPGNESEATELADAYIAREREKQAR